ncbi:EAL domain-containing protein [Pseudanabaena sp. PCC 6802]|uniref:EAL domain-containing protein n=1 Tax=Pseudanabaena sp. PCC 6802 TaxID=118173 RepID=UPI000364D0E1|nr:EAL domain-containing protein [Pseudanabaena sp. PCC 6802]
MQNNKGLHSLLPPLRDVLDSNVLTVTQDTPLVEIIKLIGYNGRRLEADESKQEDASSSVTGGNDFTVVVNELQLVGIITEAAILGLISRGEDISAVHAADVMVSPLATLEESDFQDIFAVLDLLKHHQSNCLPILNDRGCLVGVVTLDKLLQALEVTNLLKYCSVAEFMQVDLVSALPSTSVLSAAKLMAKHSINYAIVLADESVGLITARDIIYLSVRDRGLSGLSVGEVMNANFDRIDRDDSLWHAHQMMQRLQVSQLGVVDRRGNLVGVMPQLSILEVFNPTIVYGFAANLQQQVNSLKQEKLELLQSLNKSAEVPETQSNSTIQAEIERDYLLAIIAMRLRQSLDLEEILETAALEIRVWLQSDRVFIYPFDPNWDGILSLESVSALQWSLLGRNIRHDYFDNIATDSFLRGNAIAIEDISQARIEQTDVEFLTELQVKSSLIVPIPRGNKLWGLMVIHHCTELRQWQPTEIAFLERFAPQLAITIHQSSLLEQSQVELAERKLAEAKLLHNAFHDSLTDLPNRALFMDRLSHAVERTKRHSSHLFAVLFLDIDRFKVVNDSLGHTIGDQLLIAIAKRLQSCLYSSDTFARLGGDEFTILLEDIADYSEAISLADRLQQELHQPFVLSGYEVFTSVSIGIVMSSFGYEDPESMLRDADTAMYRAKARGKAQYVMFEPAMYAGAVTRLQSEIDMRKAIERNELRLFYQPIMSLATKKVTGFEALLRWHHPERGFIFPIDFIALAEETGLIVAIGEWVLREACRQLLKWQAQFPLDTPLTISVNISSLQVTQPNFIDQVEQILQETGLDPKCLKLEITETALMDNLDIACKRFEQLRNRNIQVYIDDFGTGYSSFGYLQNLPIDVLKIDKSFINKIAFDENSLQIVQAIMSLARSIGMGVVAEGVETSEQLACLEAMGQESVQGYFISRPVDSLAAEMIVRELQAET